MNKITKENNKIFSEILSFLKVDEGELNTVIYDSGVRWVESRFWNEQLQSQIIRHKLYWGWWKSVWLNYSYQFLKEYKPTGRKYIFTDFKEIFESNYVKNYFIPETFIRRIVKLNKLNYAKKEENVG